MTDPKRIIEEGYDRLGARYLQWTTAGGPGVREWFLDEVLQRLPAGAAVLELGCGPGTVSPVLADGRRYTGIDLSERQLALARERLPDGTFIKGDFTTIELPAAAFDGVVAFFVFNHVPRDEHAPMFARVYSWLRPGGRVPLGHRAEARDLTVRASGLRTILEPVHELQALEDVGDRRALVVHQSAIQPDALREAEVDVGWDLRRRLGPGHPEPSVGGEGGGDPVEPRISSVCSVANTTPTSSGFAILFRSFAPSGMGVRSRSNPSGVFTSKTLERSRIPSFLGSGVPE